MTTPNYVEVKIASWFYLGQKVFFYRLYILAFLLTIKTDHKEHFKSMFFERIDYQPTYESQAFEQAAKISQEVEQAISLSLPHHCILI